jgi:hypothetical protein
VTPLDLRFVLVSASTHAENVQLGQVNVSPSTFRRLHVLARQRYRGGHALWQYSSILITSPVWPRLPAPRSPSMALTPSSLLERILAIQHTPS